MPKRATNKVTVLLSDEEFQRLDSFCRDRGYKKSTLVARLIRQFLDLEGYGASRDNPAARQPRSSGR